MRATAMIFAGALASAPSSAEAQTMTQGRFDTMLFAVEWRPRCEGSRPLRPQDRSAAELQRYRRAALAHIDCIERQAQHDAEVAAEAIREGQRRAMRSAQTNMEADLR